MKERLRRIENLELANYMDSDYNRYIQFYIVTGELVGKPAERRLMCFDP